MNIAVTTSAHDIRDPRVHLRMALGLAGRGYDVQLIGGFNDSSDPSLFKNRVATRLEWFELTGMATERSSGFVSTFHKANIRLKRFREIRRLWEEQQPDLIIIMDPELAPMAHKWAAKHSRKWILDLHEDGFDPYYPKNQLLRQLIKFTFNKADGVIWAFEPRGHHRELLQMNRSVTAQNFFPFSLYDDFKPDAGHFQWQDLNETASPSSSRLLYTGIIGKERGLHHMIRLIAELRRAGLEASGIMAGRCYQPGYLNRLRELISALGIENNFRLIGGDRFIDWFELQKLHEYTGYGYLIYPSDALQWYRPTKVYEYAAHHIPILASGVAEFRTLFEEHPIGRLVESPTLQGWNSGIAEQVQEVMNGPSRHPESFTTFNNQHTWGSQLDNIETLINKIG